MSNNAGGDMITFNSDVAELNRIRDFVISRAKKFGFSEDDAYKISLAVDEACTNLIEHAYKFEDDKPIVINIDITDKKFIVSISDQGAPFDPLEYPRQNMKEYFRQFKKGGLGIHIIKSVMDDIIYLPSSKKKPFNVLKMQKKLN